MKAPVFTIIKPLEAWSNGYFATFFEYAGLHWQLMNSDGKDEPLHCRIHYSSRNADRLWEPQHRWFEDMQHSLPTFDGIMSVECAVDVLHLLKAFHAKGTEHGRQDAQADIRSSLGIK